MYLNTKQGFNNFNKLLKNKKLYVDKSLILEILNARVDTEMCNLCVTRPRRFGKSQMTYLIESYYSKALNSEGLFDKLAISKTADYKEYLNKFNVIKIDFSNISETHTTYQEYIDRILDIFNKDLNASYPDLQLDKYVSIADKLLATNEDFIFIFDEWDYIFNKNLYTEKHNDFLEFLRNLLKGRPYVSLCYMTGILPIKKHSSTSALNMFEEYTLLDDGIFEEFFGFTEPEVRSLCQKNKMDYNELEYWYNGYKTESGLKIFNPKSVNTAIIKKKCKSYWVNTGGMNEILEYLEIDPTNVRDDMIRMINDEELDILIVEEFRAGQGIPTTKEEIYSAMITLGFLTYSDGLLSIPNKELRQEFEKALKDKCFGKTAEIFKTSKIMLNATLAHDTDYNYRTKTR